MGHRIPAALLVAALLGAGCASGQDHTASSPGSGFPRKPDNSPATSAVSPRLHHLLDLDDARAPLRELEPFLRDADPEVRARAALAAARSAPTEAAPALRVAIADREPRVRAAAAFAMGISGDADLAGDALLHAKRLDAGDDERAAAAAAAVRLGGERVWREEAFGALFTSTVPAVRRAAFRALPGAVRGWKEKPTALPAWFRGKVLDGGESDPAVRVACRIALRTLLAPKPDEPIGNPPAWGLEEIAAALKSANKSDGDDDARCAGWHLAGLIDARLGRAAEWPAEGAERARVGLVRGVARNSTPESLERLCRVIDSLNTDPLYPSFHVRATACEAIAVRKGEAASAWPVLANAARNDSSRLVRISATTALHAIGGDHAKRLVIDLSKSEDAFVRAAAVGTLLPIEDLARLAKDAEPRVRQSAVDEAAKRKEEGKPICLESLRDLDPVVAGMAAGGLGRLEAADAVPALEEVLRAHPAPAEAPDDWADLRAGVIEALGELKAPSARALAEAHLGDPDPAVRDAAAKVIEGLDGKKPVMPVPPRLLPFPDRAALTISDAAASRVRFETDRGTFVVETIPSAAPVHCARFLERVRAKGYDGTIFHRVVPAFVIQGGDPRGDGSGNGGAPTRQEFSPVPYGRGVLGVPRSDPQDSGGCQLFFCHGDTPHLDQRYTIMGRIVEGVEVIDLIDIGDRILRATLLE